MDISGDVTQCINHPNTPSDGAICALCLQEKLGKLVKSSSTSFSISQILPSTTITTSSPPSPPQNNQPHPTTTTTTIPTGPTRPAHESEKNVTAEQRKRRGRFWSLFFHHRSPSTNGHPKTAPSSVISSQNGVVPRVINEAASTATTTSFSRSRSIGCGGSRSFSGDFFGKISTGFGGCRTLRRVESQREGNPNRSSVAASVQSGSGDVIKERVRCGGIFSGFMMTSSSSSSSSSFRLSSSTASEEVAAPAAVGPGRGRGRGWAFASPMRVFGRYSREEAKTKTMVAGKGKPRADLSAIPSLVTARG